MIDELEVLKSKNFDFRKYIKRCWNPLLWTGFLAGGAREDSYSP